MNLPSFVVEHWKLLVAGASASSYVFLNAKDHPFITRILQVGVSAGLGASTFESISLWAGAPSEFVLIGVIVLGYAALDIITKIGRDPEFWKDIIKKRLEK